MKNKKILIVIMIVVLTLLIIGLIYHFTTLEKKEIKQPEDNPVVLEKEKAENIILEANPSLDKSKLKYLSSSDNVYIYSYQQEGSTAAITYEVNIETEKYTLSIGQVSGTKAQ